ncbi:metabotropic glutamate receptor 7-like [Anneissia japonica]|uniref:metabotropic glutamate receptor 7-like n=1 Tax=Anneissia japonica TaxID=1529436 RepID=UPI001425ACA6|nr:metabotropic glutamate receptor 7-like [Anneissia japonica]XP_033124444.1 metabotropic glutamate receptor 7-like [Anneissia japonica]
MDYFFSLRLTECLILIFLHLLTTSLQSHLPDIKTNVYKKHGDFIIGVLADVHQLDDDGQCTKIQDLGVLHRLEAIAYTLDHINSQNDILPNVTIGFEILDTCGEEDTLLSQAMRFVPPDSFRTESCTSAPETGSSDVVSVIGTEWSATTMTAAMMYGIIHLPLVSYFATSDDLTNKNRFPYFLRVVPPDRFQMQAIVDLLLYFEWHYITVLYSDDTYGRNAIKNLIKQISNTPNESICIASSFEISHNSILPSDFDHVIDSLRSNEPSMVLILILRVNQGNGMLGALREAGFVGQFQIIGCDAWGRNIYEINEENLVVAKGSLKIHFHAVKNEKFEKFFESLTPESNENPWFKEYWDAYLVCNASNGSTGIVDETKCTDAYQDCFSKESSVSLVVDAVTTIALALDAMIKEGHSSNVGGQLLYDYMKNTSFPGSGGLVEFDDHGDLPGIYVIETIQSVGNGYQFLHVGTWESIGKGESFSTNRLQINESNIVWLVNGRESESPVLSKCSLPCKAGHIRIKNNDCCWTCVNCSENQISTEAECHTCLDNEKIDLNRTTCVPFEPVYIQWENAWAVGLSVLASVGLGVSTYVLVMFIKYNGQKLIKASSRELSGIMLFGVFMSFSLVFSIISKPTKATCFVNRIGFMLCFTIIYASLLVRVNRIHRIFSAGMKSTKKPRFISPRSQIAFASALISVQVLISGISLLIMKADTDIVVVQPHVRTVLICKIAFIELVGSLCYNLFLIICCTYYAFVSRKVPNNYNESRFINMSVYTTLIIWLGFIPSYFLIGDTLLRVSVMSLVMIFSAFVTLWFMFLPKIYAILYLNDEKYQLQKVDQSLETMTKNHPLKRQERNKIAPII